MKRVLGLSLAALFIAAWGCGSDDASGGGSGGASGAAAGTAGGGSGAGATAGGGGDAGAAGAAGAAGGAGGAVGGGAGTAGSGTDGGVDAQPDAYVYGPCTDACAKGKDACNYTPETQEDCVLGCTTASLGSCATQLQTFLSCFSASTEQVECSTGRPSASDCAAEFQAFGQCHEG